MTEIVRPLAIGLDIVDIRRIASVLDKYPHRFAERIFTREERRRADRRPQGAGVNNSRAATYARRFAAKEACAKALGTGVPRRGVHWRDIEVRNLPSGAPEIHLSGGALARAKSLVNERANEKAKISCEPELQVSLTDEYPYAQAIVWLLARSVPAPADET